MGTADPGLPHGRPRAASPPTGGAGCRSFRRTASRPAGWKPENLRWLLARLGPVSLGEFGAHLGIAARRCCTIRGGFQPAARAELFRIWTR